MHDWVSRFGRASNNNAYKWRRGHNNKTTTHKRRHFIWTSVYSFHTTTISLFERGFLHVSLGPEGVLVPSYAGSSNRYSMTPENPYFRIFGTISQSPSLDIRQSDDIQRIFNYKNWSPTETFGPPSDNRRVQKKGDLFGYRFLEKVTFLVTIYDYFEFQKRWPFCL